MTTLSPMPTQPAPTLEHPEDAIPGPARHVPVRHYEVHVYHHFPEGIPVQIVKTRRVATAARLTVGAKVMTNVAVTVDTTNEVASIQWVDDHGDTDAAKPEGIKVDYTSSNPSVLTVDDDGTIHVLTEGHADIGVAIVNEDGTPWGDPTDPVGVNVTAGAAVGARLTLGESVIQEPPVPGDPGPSNPPDVPGGQPTDGGDTTTTPVEPDPGTGNGNPDPVTPPVEGTPEPGTGTPDGGVTTPAQPEDTPQGG